MGKNRKHFFILLGIYTIILIWGIVLKTSNLDSLKSNFYSMVKLDLLSRLTYSPLNPFSMIYTTPIYNVLNFVGFIPYGFLVSALSKKKSFAKTVGLSLMLSLILEIMQIFTATGGFATSDLMFNTLGGAVGYVIFAVFCLIMGKFSQGAQEKAAVAVAVLGYTCFVPLAIYGIAKTLYHMDFYLSLIEPMINSLR